MMDVFVISKWVRLIHEPQADTDSLLYAHPSLIFVHLKLLIWFNISACFVSDGFGSGIKSGSVNDTQNYRSISSEPNTYMKNL